jgi:hypothetical protein
MGINNTDNGDGDEYNLEVLVINEGEEEVEEVFNL